MLVLDTIIILILLPNSKIELFNRLILRISMKITNIIIAIFLIVKFTFASYGTKQNWL